MDKVKGTARLENWYVYDNGIQLIGHIQDDSEARFIDGHRICTSELISLDEANNTAETLNTIYTLGKRCEGR